MNIHEKILLEVKKIKYCGFDSIPLTPMEANSNIEFKYSALKKLLKPYPKITYDRLLFYYRQSLSNKFNTLIKEEDKGTFKKQDEDFENYIEDIQSVLMLTESKFDQFEIAIKHKSDSSKKIILKDRNNDFKELMLKYYGNYIVDKYKNVIDWDKLKNQSPYHCQSKATNHFRIKRW